MLQNSWRINSLHRAVVPDSLHTWSKGLIENLISQTLICFRQVARLDKAYSHNLSMLDTNIGAFPAHHTLSPWKFTRFPRGITAYQKKNKSKKEGNCTTGFFSGSIPAHRLSGLLAQLLFSIRLDGTILPTAASSNALYRNNLQTNQLLIQTERCDIQNTLVDSIVTALDFDMYSRAPFMKATDIVPYKKLLSNTVYKFIKVFRMNSVLSQLRKPTTNSNSSVKLVAKNPGGVKMHLLFHSLDNIEIFGKEKNSTDTEITESYQKVIKNASQRGTQKTRTEGVEIVKIVNRKLRASELDALVRFSTVIESEAVDDKCSIVGETIDKPSLQFEVAKNCSHQNVYVDIENRQVEIEDKYKNVHGKRIKLVPLLHELLNFESLFTILQDNYACADDRQIRLLNSLKCNGSPHHGIEPFMIHANSNYCTEVGGHLSIQSNQQDFGFVKIDVEDEEGLIDTFSALVVGIVEESSINCLETERIIFSQKVLVCWLEPVAERDRVKTVIPYTQVRFTFANRSTHSPLWFDLVCTTAIKAPLFVIPILSSIDDYVLGQSIGQHRRKIKFFELSIDKVIFWSAAEYDNFTEGNSSVAVETPISMIDASCIAQEEIDRASDLWREIEVEEIESTGQDEISSVASDVVEENEQIFDDEDEEDYDLEDALEEEDLF